MPATVWKGFISFGLVSFPVRLTAAARAERVQFHLLHKKDHSRVKEVWYCAKEEKPIERSEMVKGYETSKGKYVAVDEEELEKIAPPTARTMDIIQFVDVDEVDPVYFESSYYVGADEDAARPYSLFAAALANTKQHAIARLAMHNREHIVLMRPYEEGLILHTLYFPNELHKANRSEAPRSKAAAKELDLAKTLVTHLHGPFKPSEFHDTYRENVERLIEQKRKGEKVTPVEQPKTAKVIDLMEALKASLKSGHSAKKQAPRKRSARPARKRAA